MSNTIKLVSKFILLIFTGILIILLCRMIQHVSPPQVGEYYYSSILRDNYTVLSACVLFVVGLLIGYYVKLNPWLVGISLILIFPIVSFYEATIYRGSHNLIPFELVIHFLFSLPAVAGVYLGKFIERKKTIYKT
ncbi:MAG: hypothetical protein WKF91_17790 [Segetibacter sp.]